jgi:hypothetical protein
MHENTCSTTEKLASSRVIVLKLNKVVFLWNTFLVHNQKKTLLELLDAWEHMLHHREIASSRVILLKLKKGCLSIWNAFLVYIKTKHYWKCWMHVNTRMQLPLRKKGTVPSQQKN